MQCHLRSLIDTLRAWLEAFECQEMPYDVYKMQENAWRRAGAPPLTLDPAGGAYVTTCRLRSKTGTVLTRHTDVSVTSRPSFSTAEDCLLGET